MRGYTTGSRVRRWTLILLLIALPSLALWACRDDTGDNAAASTTPTAQQALGAQSTPSTIQSADTIATPESTTRRTSPSADPEALFPITLTDDAGNTITLSTPPRRIVAVLPSVVDLLIDLGHADRIIAADDFSLDRLPQATSIGGNNFAYNLEALAEIEPDLIIVAQDGTDDLRSGASELNLPLFVLDFPANINEMLLQLSTIGRLLGAPESADVFIADLRARINAVAAKGESASPLRVYLEVDQSTPSQPFTVGPGSIHNEILTLSGGINIFADADIDFPQTNWEAIIERDPEVILLLDSEEFSDELAFNPVSVEEVGERTGWHLISAVRNNQVVPLPNNLFSVGAGLVDALERVAGTLAEARDALTAPESPH